MNSLALRLGAVVAVLFSAAAARAAPVKETPRKEVVLLAVPFTADDDASAWAGFAASEELTDLFSQEDRGAWVSSKQLDAALRRKDLQLYDAGDLEVALPLARTLGATDVIAGAIQLGDGDQQVTVVGPKKITLHAERWSAAAKARLREASVSGPIEQLPQLVQQLGVKLLDLSPKTKLASTNVAALEAASRCWRGLVRYPIQPRAGIPPPLDGREGLLAECEKAEKADPRLAWAQAGAAILHALEGHLGDAQAAAKSSERSDRFEAWSYIAESFVARRADDAAGSLAALERGLKLRPGFLLAASYLAEDRMDAGDYQAASAAWDRVLKRAPDHPYALGQKAKALGYLHKDRDALSLTRRALDFDPGDPELLIELGSRQLDAGDRAGAEQSLRAAMEARPPRPIAWLRLGWLYILENRPRDARDTLLEAVTYAYRDDEARTRAGLFADLALVAGMENKEHEALEYLQQARSEGYGKLPCDAPQLKGLRGKAAIEEVCK